MKKLLIIETTIVLKKVRPFKRKFTAMTLIDNSKEIKEKIKTAEAEYFKIILDTQSTLGIGDDPPVMKSSFTTKTIHLSF